MAVTLREAPEREEALARAWQGRWFSGGLTSDQGLEVEVAFPGERERAGPDFQGAVLLHGGRREEGDVELHLRSGLWWQHRHHTDPRYSRVILHVVLTEDDPRPTTGAGGSPIPRLSLKGRLKGGLEEASQLPLLPQGACSGRPWRGEELHPLLDSLGEERFRLQAAAFAPGGEEDLYRGVVGALGYSRNRGPMEEVARRLPFSRLRKLCRGVGDPAPYLESLFLKAREGLAWQWSGVRPANSPERRLAAAAYLLARYLPQGLLAGLLPLVKGGRRALREGLVVRHPSRGSLLGEERAEAIAVNVVLPFAWAWGGEGFKEAALETYRSYPAPGDNRASDYMRRLLPGVEANSARRHQGLLHLYKSFCRRGDCPACPLSRWL